MRIFHGTSLSSAQNIAKYGVLLSKGKPFTDFGKGFYTANRNFAEKTAISMYKKSQKKGVKIIPAIVEFEYDETMENSLKTLTFEEENLDWLQFILNNRIGYNYVNFVNEHVHNLSLDYDIVKGRVSDGSIIFVKDEVSEELRHANMGDLERVIYRNNKDAYQISFHTPEALAALKYVKYDVLKEV